MMKHLAKMCTQNYFFPFWKNTQLFFLLKYCKNKYIFCVFASFCFYFYFLPFFFCHSLLTYTAAIYILPDSHMRFFLYCMAVGWWKDTFYCQTGLLGHVTVSVSVSRPTLVIQIAFIALTHVATFFFWGMCPYPKVLFFVFFVQCKVAELSYCFENRRPLLPPRVTGGDTAEQPVADIKLQSSEPCRLGPGNVLSSRAPLVPLSMP